MAMLMSTADSLINAMAVIFAHDLCKPLGFKWSQNELNVSKIFSVVSGVLGVIFALKFTSILDIIVLVFGLYISVVSLPFILAILGFRSSEKSVLIGMVAGGAAFILCQLKLIEANVMTDPCSLGIITNIVFLFASHYLLRQPGGFVGIKNGHNKADV
jgi:Na+/proline symporter